MAADAALACAMVFSEATTDEAYALAAHEPTIATQTIGRHNARVRISVPIRGPIRLPTRPIEQTTHASAVGVSGRLPPEARVGTATTNDRAAPEARPATISNLITTAAPIALAGHVRLAVRRPRAR